MGRGSCELIVLHFSNALLPVVIMVKLLMLIASGFKRGKHPDFLSKDRKGFQLSGLSCRGDRGKLSHLFITVNIS